MSLNGVLARAHKYTEVEVQNVMDAVNRMNKNGEKITYRSLSVAAGFSSTLQPKEDGRCRSVLDLCLATGIIEREPIDPLRPRKGYTYSVVGDIRLLPKKE